MTTAKKSPGICRPARRRRSTASRWVLLLVVLLAALSGCRCESTEVVLDVSTPRRELPSASVQPPGPVVETALPAHLERALPRSDDGLPVLLRTHTPVMGPEISVEMVYDAALDDPITRWADCLSRVSACDRANPGLPVAGCVAQIEICPDATGGRGCCPSPCVEEFRRRMADGEDEEEALEKSFVQGDCVEGFREFVVELEANE